MGQIIQSLTKMIPDDEWKISEKIVAYLQINNGISMN